MQRAWGRPWSRWNSFGSNQKQKRKNWEKLEGREQCVKSMGKGGTGDEREKEEGSDGTGSVACRKQLGLHFEGTEKSPVGFIG